MPSFPTELNESFSTSLDSWMPRAQRWLVAVSGGLDSMALLHWLCEAGYRDLVVGHVNHQLRGEESDGDSQFVAQAASSLELELESEALDVRRYSEEMKCSLEVAARKLRYGSFAKWVERRNCSGVITAHHADDQVETVLINFFRGTGSRGLSGMDALSENENGLRVFRPFLPIRRAQLEAFIAEKGINYRQDESNFEDFALRNRVRNRLLPFLGEIFERDVRRAVLRAAELAALDEKWIEEALGDMPHYREGLSVEALRKMNEAERNRTLLRWLRNHSVPNCGFDEIAGISEILGRDENPSKGNLPGGFHVRRRAGVLFLEKDGQVISGSPD